MLGKELLQESVQNAIPAMFLIKRPKPEDPTACLEIANFLKKAGASKFHTDCRIWIRSALLRPFCPT